MREFILPIRGMGLGNHHFEFVIDANFFRQIEFSEIVNANVQVQLELIKNENMIELDFHLNGKLEVPCDRCAEEYWQPIEGTNRMFIKFGESFEEESDEVLVLPVQQDLYDISHLVYEFMILLLPMKRVHPVDEHGISSCNAETISKLNQMEVPEVIDPRWDILKNLKTNNTL